jgi:hypothetical protein
MVFRSLLLVMLDIRNSAKLSHSVAPSVLTVKVVGHKSLKVVNQN